MSDSGSQLAVFEGTGQQHHEAYRHVIVSLLPGVVHSFAAAHDAGAVRSLVAAHSLLENGRWSIDRNLHGCRIGFVLEAVHNRLEAVHNHLGTGHILLGLHTDCGFEIVHGCLVSNRNLLGLRTGWSFETGYSLAGYS